MQAGCRRIQPLCRWALVGTLGWRLSSWSSGKGTEGSCMNERRSCESARGVGMGRGHHSSRSAGHANRYCQRVSAR
ncbi:hypothetical protein BJV74DRAFT_838352 [Russula compacta]|nr:hypothetical protein BJV74DRAFT_838352 [Russula compacta]